MAAKRASEAEDDVPELLTWEDDVDGEEEEEDFEDELPADEMMFAGEEDGEGERGGEESVELEGDDLKTGFAKYTRIFRAALENNNRMCLCGIMTAEYDDLPPEVRVEVDRFTDVNVQWIARMLANADPKANAEALRDRAMAIFSAIEGAQLVARGRNDINIFDQSIRAYGAAGLM